MDLAIDVVVNGERQRLQAATVAQLVQTLGLPAERVAVELNGALVLRQQHAQTPVKQGDQLEIVTLVGGG